MLRVIISQQTSCFISHVHRQLIRFYALAERSWKMQIHKTCFFVMGVTSWFIHFRTKALTRPSRLTSFSKDSERQSTKRRSGCRLPRACQGAATKCHQQTRRRRQSSSNSGASSNRRAIKATIRACQRFIYSFFCLNRVRLRAVYEIMHHIMGYRGCFEPNH